MHDALQSENGGLQNSLGDATSMSVNVTTMRVSAERGRL